LGAFCVRIEEMVIDIITLFPEMFAGLKSSIVKRAQDKNKLTLRFHQLRDFAGNKYGTVDDSPYGGGPGMVMKADVVDRALSKVESRKSMPTGRQAKVESRTILFTPQGRKFTQEDALRLSKYDRLILFCAHYEGVDERVRNLFDEEISLGDFVLTGGEIPAMAVVDSVARLIPGVLGKDESSHEESFSKVKIPPDLARKYNLSLNAYHLLEYPHYTRPDTYKGKKVPSVLKSGNHAEIRKWRLEEAIKRTLKRRPDLLR
jgi:tRNA (guanine37-N1)-methyltransferase